ncbi:MAG: hypothetical protein DWI49_02630 [Chloroflexi bacterium]|jgi:phosphohistidine phosphatase|nr:MAG: hypothetical protein DWI49_02630 [Chloroflexota bacterium]
MGEATVRLLFIRHGDAGDPGEWIGPDVERPLTDRGVKQVSRLAAGLLAARTKIDAVRTSPARRCGETAAIIAAALDIVPSADALLAEGLELNDLTKLVPKRAGCVALVGHEPHLVAVARELTGIAHLTLPKGSMLRVDAPRPFAPGSGELIWLAPPSLFRAPKEER